LQRQAAGASFIALFEDDLYFEISKKANFMAKEIKNAFMRKGTGFYRRPRQISSFQSCPTVC
jgi:threonine aldolase